MGYGYSQAQESVIELLNATNEDGIIVSAQNHSTIRQEVTITLTIKNLTGYTAPISKLINAKETVEVVRLAFIPGKKAKGGYASSYTYKPKPTEAEIALQDEKLKAKTVTHVDDMNDGIVLFYRDGCPRCAYVTTYMLDNNIDFKLLDTTSNEKSQIAMWKLLKEVNPELKTIKFPVVLVNGKLNYNMEDIKVFTKGLPKG